MSTDVTGSATLSDQVIEEILGLMGRRRMNKAEMARRLNVKEDWIGRRLNGRQPLDLGDLQRIAVVLGVGVADLFPREERAKTVWYSPGERVVATAGEQRRKASTPVVPLQRQHRPGRAVSATRPIGRVPASTVR